MKGFSFLLHFLIVSQRLRSRSFIYCSFPIQNHFTSFKLFSLFHSYIKVNLCMNFHIFSTTFFWLFPNHWQGCSRSQKKYFWATNPLANTFFIAFRPHPISFCRMEIGDLISEVSMMERTSVQEYFVYEFFPANAFY